MSKYKLIMLRHGEGAWYKENRFCSWVDQKLNNEGMEEARNCGKQLKALNFECDLVYPSVPNQSIHTVWLILEELGQDEEQVKLWRRSYSVSPPIEESHPYYHEIYNDRRYEVCDVPVDQLPRSESLKDVLERLLPFWNERIAPEMNITLPTGVPILLEVDENLHAAGPHQLLGDQEAVQAAIRKVEDQGKLK
ncbi:hypothetical protein MC885_012181 [Smutsia gigantea]|nr:hypothetical protein MC885_012181 [Smutsia gigantea]